MRKQNEENKMQLIEELSMTQILILQWVMNVSRYFIIVGGSYLLFWKYLKRKYDFKSFNPRETKRADLKREIFYSLQTLTIFLIPTFLIVYFSKSQVFQVYFDLSDKSLWWYVLSYILVFFIHDTYFYWTHRAMHSPKLFKRFHYIHHRSVYPTPFAAFSFNATEAIMESSVFLLIAIIMPVHISVLIVFTLFSLLMNVYGHMGMNLLPEETQKKWPLEYIQHPTHHSWHHRHFNGNYGLYLKFWDKLMGSWKGGM